MFRNCIVLAIFTSWTHAWQEHRTEGDAVVAPLAAHHAAAMDRVWWLEVCAATPGARKINL